MSHEIDVERLVADLPRFELAKNNANALYREGKYQGAAQSYTRVIAEILGDETLQSDLNKLIECAKKSGITDERLSAFVATLFSNAALCRFQEKNIDEAERLWQTCLLIDENNYKAAYQLAQCCIQRKQYNDAMTCVRRCQTIADATFMDKSKTLPHAKLLDEIVRGINQEKAELNGMGCCDDIIAAIEAGDSVLDNLGKLDALRKEEIAGQRVLPRLFKIIVDKPDVIQNMELHAYMWTSIHLMYQNTEKYMGMEMMKQVEQAVKEHNFDLVQYAKDLMAHAHCKTDMSQLLRSLAYQFSRCCYDMGTAAALEAISVIIEHSDCSEENRLFFCVWQFFVHPRATDKLPLDDRFIPVIQRVLEIMLGRIDIDCNDERQEMVERCLVPVFMMKNVRYDITEEMVSDLAKRMLNGYITTSFFGTKTIQPQWYVIMRCLHLTNKKCFKEYVIENNVIVTMLECYMKVRPRVRHVSRLLINMSETILCCMDYMELRQLVVEAVVGRSSLVEFLRDDVELAKFLAETTGRDEEIDKYCKEGRYTFVDQPKVDQYRLIQEYKLLILAKMAVHCPQLAKEIFEIFELVSIIPMALVNAMIDGRRVDVMIDALSFVTLHAEAKRGDVVKHLQPLIRWAESSELCKGKTMFMVCQSLVNLTRSRNHRQGFNRDATADKMFDEEQMEAMRQAFEKLPAASKPLSNGEYDEGTEEEANRARKEMLALHEEIAKVLINISRRTIRDAPEGAGIAAQTLMLETLHYLTFPPENRTTMRAAGAMRCFLNAYISDTHKDTRRIRYFAQSMAHICFSSDPKTLKYSDAQDAAGPMVKLLGDSNELLQYEAALGLTNLLLVDDGVSERIWKMDAWDGFGNLLSSDNPQLKAACLEGWCNFASAVNHVQTRIYNKLGEQWERALKKLSKSGSTCCDRVWEAEDGDEEEDEHRTVPLLEVHDVNVMFMFAADDTDMRCVKASTGALAYLAHDLRVAKYLPMCSRYSSIITAADKIQDRDAMQRILTFFVCVLQGQIDSGPRFIKKYIANAKKEIRECTERNFAKIKDLGLTELAEEVRKYSDVANNLVS